MGSFWPGLAEHEKLVLLVLGTAVLSVAPCGYHMVVLNVPVAPIQRTLRNEIMQDYNINITDSQMDLLWSSIVSCQSIGALLGCVLLIPLESMFGIKNALMLISNLTLLSVGRLLIGVQTGLATALVPMYVQELAPAKVKGSLSCFVHIAVCSGAAFGAFLSLDSLLGNERLWHLLLFLPGICTLLQLFFARQIPHTPGFYLARNDREMASQSIRFFYGFPSNLSDEDLIVKYRGLVSKVPPQVTFRQSLQSPITRRGIALGMIVSATQILSGSMAAVSYSTSMFTSLSIINGLVPLFPTFGSVLSIVLTLPVLKLVETYGRKRLLINTLIMCAAANYFLFFFSLILKELRRLADVTVALLLEAGTWAAFLFFLSFVALGVGYNLGTGPVAYFIPGELVPPESIGTAMSCAVATNWTFTMLTTFFYYPLNEAVGGWSYLMFALPTTLCILILYRFLPETKYPHAVESQGLLLACNVLPDIEEDTPPPDHLHYGAI